MATRTREKAAAHKISDDKRPHATAKYIRISARKVQVVIDLIRGKSVDEALAILAYTPKSASPVVEKLLSSAIANAENNLQLGPRNPVRGRSLRQSGADPEALLGTLPRQGRRDPEAQQSHHHRPGRCEVTGKTR